MRRSCSYATPAGTPSTTTTRCGRKRAPQGLRHAGGRAHEGAGIPLSVPGGRACREDRDRLSGTPGGLEPGDLAHDPEKLTDFSDKIMRKDIKLRGKQGGRMRRRLFIGLAAVVAAAGSAVAQSPVERGRHRVT